jgi:2-octaprenyl-6-methoxyphenol hydroxylase
MPAADVLIAGAGPVGCTLALALEGCAHAVRVVDPQAGGAPPAFRPIALSHASRLILERVGAWGAFPVTPIDTIHVSQAGAFGRTRMRAAEAGVPALGYVTQYGDLVAALRARLRIERETGEAPPRLTVHAEGRAEDARERRYAQDAIVARIAAEPASQATAYERFTGEGPLALLPIAGEWALIWSARPERAAALASASEPEFLEALQRAFGERAGRFTGVRSRACLPLARRVRAARIGARTAFIGNAAQTLHPVAGQGLNLGLRDAWDLAQALRAADDPGAAPVLARYAAARRLDAAATRGITELLARGFLGAHPLSRAARGAALALLDALPPARNFFARRMIFGPSALP